MTWMFWVGVAATAFGVVTLLARFFGWEKIISKKAEMQKRFGEKRGDAIHLVAYSILPIVFGIVFIASELAGG